MALAEQLTYRVVDSDKLTIGQHRDIDDLLRRSLQIDYQRGQDEIDCMVRESSTNRSSPNRAVGGATIRAHQAFAKSVNVVAVNGAGNLVAHLPAADNASSPEFTSLPHLVSDVVGAGLRQAKLHVPAEVPYGENLIRRRWLWLGMCGLGQAVRQDLAEVSKEDVTVVDGLLAAAAQARKPQQPVAAYPYDDEFAWKKGLARAGLKPLPGSRILVSAFGSAAEGVGQEKWSAPDIADMLKVITAKHGAARLLARIKASG